MITFEDIHIKDLNFTSYILRKELMNRIQEIAIDINQDYVGRNPLFISVLNGAFMFTSDLMKQIDIDSEIKFINVSSYEGTKSTGVKKDFDFGDWVTDRHIIFIEDIVDTGNTMKYLLDKIDKWDPSSVEIATLFVKRMCLSHEMNLRYVGFEIENKFIVGYGLDYDGQGRNYQDVYQLAQ
jgi:hypoxanthine phosphoribosyltransferase